METVHVVSMMGMFTTGIMSMGNDRDMVKYTLPMEICIFKYNNTKVKIGKMIQLMGLGGIIIAMAICKLFWFMSANSV